ncbi:hypothetical protein J6590_049349 [Homalodisca vitripennis]|nr:hypothetical protein J6590_049349 [Homalodisca vitripennis]
MLLKSRQKEDGDLPEHHRFGDIPHQDDAMQDDACASKSSIVVCKPNGAIYVYVFADVTLCGFKGCKFDLCAREP